MNESADHIQQQMAMVRNALNSDVAEVVESAQDLLDWKTYVRQYPWVVAGGAGLIGFLVAPRFSRHSTAVASHSVGTARQGHSVAQRGNPYQSVVERIVSTTTTIATGALIRAGVNLATGALEKLVSAASQPHQYPTRPTDRADTSAGQAPQESNGQGVRS